MPTEEQTYREFVKDKLVNIDSKMDGQNEKIAGIDDKVTYTNGKVKKMIIALVLISGIVIGQHFPSMKDVIELFAGSASLN